ncbi:MAG: DUF2254 domain-containing protein [Alicyclobacillus sp.]|nr:DUF2254 domain-containing protein [Alicyclobacillus sp.]
MERECCNTIVGVGEIETDASLHRLTAHLREAVSSWLFHLFFAGAVLTLVFAHPPALFSGDTDTARNYLNTIVSSLSTILALCISIILVAIQMTAGNYTARVLDFYVRLPYNVSLFLFYLGTIMHSFFLMAQIRDPVNEPLPPRLDVEMSSDLVMVAICFVSLLLYMYAVVQLLKPERIIELIRREYRRSCQRGRLGAALDSIEQICDIAKRAASFSDSVTGMRCVEVLRDIAHTLPEEGLWRRAAGDGTGRMRVGRPVLAGARARGAQLDWPDLYRVVIDQWTEIAGVAVKERETAVVTAALDALAAFGAVCVESSDWLTAEWVVRAFRHLTFSCLLSDGHILQVENVVLRVYRMAAKASAVGERGEVFALRTWQVVRTIGEATLRAHPAALPAVLPGLLLFDDFATTVNNFEGRVEQAEAVACYFMLWRAFAEAATRRDIARWARWWADAAPTSVQAMGRRVAVDLLRYLARDECLATLTAVWGGEVADSSEGWADLPERHRLDLFDGWCGPNRSAEGP